MKLIATLGMDSKSLRLVNSLQRVCRDDGSVISSIGSSDIYNLRTVAAVRKDELNIKITATGDDSLIIREVPMLDEQTIRELRAAAKTQQYFHFGCCAITLTPLFHRNFIRNFGKDLKGMIALVDPTFQNPLEGVIASFKFNLGQGRVDFLALPNHVLSLTDPNLARRVSIVIMMDAMRVTPGNEMFNLALGWAGVTSNTLNPALRHSDEYYPIANAEELQLDAFPPEFQSALSRVVRNVQDPAPATTLVPDCDDEYLHQRRLFGLLRGRTIKRRRMKLVASSSGRTVGSASPATVTPPFLRNFSARPESQLDPSWIQMARASIDPITSDASSSQ